MSRDVNGNYTLPSGNPVVTGTVIESDWANTTMSDIAQALTDSLSRSGFGGMLVPFKNADGTVGSPGMSWTNEPTSGWYRKANQEFWYSVGNEDIFQITKAGIALAPGKTALNISSFTRVQDAEPTTPPMKQGENWFESDTGALYMRYQNPDTTFTFILINGVAVGDFIPTAEKGVANGVAPLDSGIKVPMVNLYAGVPTGLATLDAGGKVPAAQIPFQAPQTVNFGAGAAGTYTTPAGAKYLKVQCLGAGGGGGGSSNGTNGGSGGNGGNTLFGPLSVGGGQGTGNAAQGGSGGGAGGGDLNINGGSGNGSGSAANMLGGMGGASYFGGTGGGGAAGNPGQFGVVGGGGGGGGGVGTGWCGAGGGAGGYSEAILSPPSASYSYSVGTGGTGGAAGTSGFPGGAGGGGLIIVTAYF